MRYILSFLVFVLVQGEIDLNHFNAGPNATVVHQLNANTLLVGTNTGNIIKYTLKGQLINEQLDQHHASIASINSYQQNDTKKVIVSDAQGIMTIWSEEGKLIRNIDKKMKIFEAVVNSRNIASLIAVNMGHAVQFYDIINFEIVRTLRREGGFFKKIAFGDESKLYYVLQIEQKSVIQSYDINVDAYQTLIFKQSVILDFSVSPNMDSHFIFLINQSKHIQIHHQSASRYITKQQSSLIISSYSSTTYFQNNQNRPLFVAVKASHQLQLFDGYDIILFLQLNSDIRTISSTLNNSLILLSSSGQVSTIAIHQANKQSIDLWIILLILVLLAIALYICCGDCCPGVIEKWRQQRERKEIELQLYRQRTELDNF